MDRGPRARGDLTLGPIPTPLFGVRTRISHGHERGGAAEARRGGARRSGDRHDDPQGTDQ